MSSTSARPYLRFRLPTEDHTELTIDALDARDRLTARNIRAYQSRGLLPPPEVCANPRHGPEHVTRIKLIQEMQADGFNLKAIRAPARRRAGGRRASPLVLQARRALTVRATSSPRSSSARRSRSAGVARSTPS